MTTTWKPIADLVTCTPFSKVALKQALWITELWFPACFGMHKQSPLLNWLFWFSIKQFNKITWNITFSEMPTMFCCYWKGLNENFSWFPFCEQKKFYSVWPENNSTLTRMSHDNARTVVLFPLEKDLSKW